MEFNRRITLTCTASHRFELLKCDECAGPFLVLPRCIRQPRSGSHQSLPVMTQKPFYVQQYGAVGVGVTARGSRAPQHVIQKLQLVSSEELRQNGRLAGAHVGEEVLVMCGRGFSLNGAVRGVKADPHWGRGGNPVAHGFGVSDLSVVGLPGMQLIIFCVLSSVSAVPPPKPSHPVMVDAKDSVFSVSSSVPFKASSAKLEASSSLAAPNHPVIEEPSQEEGEGSDPPCSIRAAGVSPAPS
ncbi:hypothetical protein EYF80_031144 [Liparis tanakae]|uniref:Uncharacterized protein n=1 Tax=Liparis tanakae TaxID=230148 RepID=A0A4Z2GZA7_9TELE|nr:hypothetical protein EYF80_031144 [Liparis tanakae]